MPAVLSGLPPSIGGILGTLIASILSGLGGGIGGDFGGGTGDMPDGGSGLDGTDPNQPDAGNVPQGGDDSGDQTPQNAEPDKPMTEEERIKKEQEWLASEKERVERERKEAEEQYRQEMERRRIEYENMQKQKEIEKQKQAALKELARIQKERAERDAYVKRLCEKYNTTPDNLRDVLRENIKMNQADADKWNEREKALGIAENGKCRWSCWKSSTCRL